VTSRSWRIIIIAAVIVITGTLLTLVLTGRLAPRTTAPPASGQAGVLSAPPKVRVPKPAGLTLHGRVEAARTHGAVAPRDARVVALSASEGQPVVGGQLLVQLDVLALRQDLSAARKQLADLKTLQAKGNDPALRDKLQATEGQTKEAVLRLQRMQTELATFERDHPDAVTILETYQAAEAEAASAALAYQNAQREFDQVQATAGRAGKPPANFEALQARYAAAAKRNGAAQARFEQVRAGRARLRDDITKLDILRQRVTSGKHMVQQTQAALERLRRTPAVAMIAQGQQRLNEANDRVANLEGEVAKLAVKAPVDGVLREIRARPGRGVRAGEVLAMVSATGGARLVFEAGAKDAARLAVGMRAKVSLPDQSTFEGAVGQLVPDQARVWVYVVPLKARPLPPPGTALVAQL